MKKKRYHPSILIFCPVLGAFGGTETHVVELSCALAALGWDVRVVVLKSRLKQEFADRMRQAGVTYASWPSLRFLWLIARRCDILYTNSQGRAASVLWNVKGRSQRGFHHIHTSANEAEQQYWPSGFRHFLKTAPRLIACSEATKANLERVRGPSGVRHIPCLISISDVGSVHSAVHERAGICRFSFIGRVEKPKGIDLILDAAKAPECVDIEWHVYGDGDYLDVLKASKLSNVFAHGAFSGSAELARIHGVTDALVLPSFHSEGLPLVLVEGIARGIPWVATDRGGVADLAKEHRHFFVVQAGDTQSFVKACATLRDAIRAGHIQSEEIQSVFQRKFSRNVVLQQWTSYLQELMNG